MIAHAFVLVWRRRRTGALIALEIFASFLVVFVVAALGVHALDNLRTPDGFDRRDVWDVKMGSEQAADEGASPEMVATARLVLAAALETPGVVGATGAMSSPYGFGRSAMNFDWEKSSVETEMDEVTDDYAAVMGLELLEGRWFSAEDDALQEGRTHVVISRGLATRLFGAGAAALGGVIPFGDDHEMVVIGVVSDVKVHGDISAIPYYTFERKRLDRADHRPPTHLLLKVAPGSGLALEKQLIERFGAVARGWSFEIRTLEEMRASNLRLAIIPIGLAALVGGFLVLMVGLGLLGVLGQNVTRRTREVGLRLALGAAPGQVRRQILLEVLVLTSFGVAAGAALTLQLPLVGALPWVRPGVLVEAVGLAALSLYALTAACGLYPSILASRVAPAEALRYE